MKAHFSFRHKMKNLPKALNTLSLQKMNEQTPCEYPYQKLKIFFGLIVPVEWDQQQNIIQIAISTPGEREYEIEMDGMGKSLIKHIRHQVNLEGYLSPSHKSAGIIKVQAYSVSDSFTR